MKNVEDFVNQLVKIDFVEQSNSYGFYPFQMIVETKDGKLEMNALALGGDVLSCYRRVKTYVNAEAPIIFMALDFPQGGDIPHDFVAVYSIINGEASIFAIPYNPVDGETYERIVESTQLDAILEQFKKIIE